MQYDLDKLEYRDPTPIEDHGRKNEVNANNLTCKYDGYWIKKKNVR